MKNLILPTNLVITFLISIAVSAQHVPLNDLGTGTYNGFMGGLYPSGANTRPTAHNNAGLQFASQIKPLDANGNYDPVNGKIVWLSVGMSNTTQETSAFIPMAEALANKNPKLVLVDGAQGGQDLDMINDPTSVYWSTITQRLTTKGLTAKQVQVIWFKQADRSFPDTTFTGYVTRFKDKLKISMGILNSKFSNTHLCYLSSRIYAGYQTGTGSNPEPYAYYTGWGVKQLIEDQINGDADLEYSGNNPKVPWLAWGPYLWANGETPRADGLKWIFPDDYQKDGIHPSRSGEQKVAQMLLDFFTKDSTAIAWFLAPNTTGVENVNLNKFLHIYPNPSDKSISINLANISGKIKIEVYNSRAELFYTTISDTQQSVTLDISQFMTGIYFIRLTTEAQELYHKKVIVTR